MMFPGRGITARLETPGTWTRNPDGSWSYQSADGTNWSGWIVVGNRWYYVEENGKLAIGWKNIEGKWYLFCTLTETEGEMLTGWQFVNGKWYFFGMPDTPEMGGMLTNATTPDNYRVGADGVWDGNAAQ